MATITTLDGFVSYIKVKLGDPVVCVELDDSQIEQCIEDVIQEFQRYNSGEGNYEDYMTLTLTSGVDEYSLSGSDVLNAIDFKLSSVAGQLNTLFSPINFALSDFLAQGVITSMGLINYHTAMTVVKEIDNYFGVRFRVDFRPATQTVKVIPTPNEEYMGVIHVYRAETAVNLYNNPLVKRLAVARCKILWGEILSKITMTLPGGGTLNGAEIIARGKEEEEKALADIKDEGEPPTFFIEG